MSPRRFRAIAALSFVACAGFAALWTISYRYERTFAFGDATQFTLSRGQIQLQWPIRKRSAKFISNSPGFGAFGFYWIGNEMIRPNFSIPAETFRMRGEQSTNQQIVLQYRDRHPPLILCGTVSTTGGKDFVVLGREMAVPIWSLVAAALVMPVKAFARARRQRRLDRIGKCKTCGYDLRASTDRCPECGTPFVRPRRKPAPPEAETSPTASAEPIVPQLEQPQS